ncbi:MAG: MepB family protein [Sporocytophaga sp.]|uniref:MepB family protein n=1 Tax=Sporocytophaga sp. TaxID=2231183 RepID=UPI001B2195E9|nr:MepB family protein [Sporocytophaga sp.]MBO9701803.1 MepB family protein [Sporocytophaga sp.]
MSNLPIPNLISEDFFIAKEHVYNQCGFICSAPQAEPESAEYGACSFNIHKKTIIFRVAKTTPTKNGQFVTIWKRINNGPIQPYDISDDFDLIVISTRKDNHLGQFVFPKSMLLEKGIISGSNKDGKRGIRVYPPWEQATSKQAEKTQGWQLRYFLRIQGDANVDIERATKLYQNETLIIK